MNPLSLESNSTDSNPTKSNLTKGIAILLSVVAAICGCAVGFRKMASPAPAHVRRQYMVAIDASYSNSKQLGLGIHLTSRLCGLMDEKDLLSVFRVDDKASQIYPKEGGLGPAINDTDKFKVALVNKLRALSTEQGTHSLEFWKQASAEMKPDMPATFYYFTDGFEENKTPEEIAELTALAKKLAANSKVRAVYLMGLNPKTEAFWNNTFKALGTRLHVCGSLTRASIDKIEEAVDAR